MQDPRALKSTYPASSGKPENEFEKVDQNMAYHPQALYNSETAPNKND
jgi:hypothetical protein